MSFRPESYSIRLDMACPAEAVRVSEIFEKFITYCMLHDLEHLPPAEIFRFCEAIRSHPFDLVVHRKKTENPEIQMPRYGIPTNGPSLQFDLHDISAIKHHTRCVEYTSSKRI
jgi:hypothetical protein